MGIDSYYHMVPMAQQITIGDRTFRGVIQDTQRHDDYMGPGRTTFTIELLGNVEAPADGSQITINNGEMRVYTPDTKQETEDMSYIREEAIKQEFDFDEFTGCKMWIGKGVGRATEYGTYENNRQLAFARLVRTDGFRSWLFISAPAHFRLHRKECPKCGGGIERGVPYNDDWSIAVCKQCYHTQWHKVAAVAQAEPFSLSIVDFYDGPCKTPEPDSGNDSGLTVTVDGGTGDWMYDADSGCPVDRIPSGKSVKHEPQIEVRIPKNKAGHMDDEPEGRQGTVRWEMSLAHIRNCMQQYTGNLNILRHGLDNILSGPHGRIGDADRREVAKALAKLENIFGHDPEKTLGHMAFPNGSAEPNLETVWGLSRLGMLVHDSPEPAEDMYIDQYIKYKRQNVGMSIREVAHAAQMPPDKYHRIEEGYQLPSRSDVSRIVEAIPGMSLQVALSRYSQ